MASKKAAGGLFRCVIMGPPGSGKGTVSGRILRHFPMVHVSSGDHIREHIANKTDFGKEAEKYTSKGKLVPNELISEIIAFEVRKLNDQNWLLDGFPRTTEQAKFLQGVQSPEAVIHLNVPFEEIIERLKLRWMHAPSGRIYNLDWNPPKVAGKDDVTGEPLTQREDDKPKTVGARLESYQKMEGPVQEYYQDMGKLVRFTGRATNELWPKIYDWMAEYLVAKQPMENK